MRVVGAILLAISLSLLSGHPAAAGKRVALVIGNSDYQTVARLSNPANDAAAMTDTFKAAGFDIVESRRDLKTSEMRRALRDFSDAARDADVAVIYYAGHGIEVDGTNYLIPVDAVLERDIDIYDEAFALDRILVTIEPARQLRLVILDACRDNPLAKSMKRTIGTRAVGRGLAKVEPNSPNTLIAFASKAGSTASDGDSRNSPFTTALVKHIAKPGLDLRRAFGFVRDDVLKNTGNRQEPYVYGSLGGDDVPLVPAKPAAAGPQSDPTASVRRDYELALQTGDREGWEAFLRAHPDGYYADLAKVQLRKMAAERSGVVIAKPAAEAAKAEQQAVASLPSADGPAPGAALSTTDIARSMQLELRRVGCLSAAANGDWSAPSRRALELFNQNAGTKFDLKVASLEALEGVKAKPSRICPVICERGFRRDGEHCTRIVCRTGYELGDDASCEKIEVKRPRQEEPKAQRERPEAAKMASRPAGPQSTQSAITRLGNSPTCTNSRLACEQSRSKFGLSTASCASAFATCMQTGKWKGAYEGLARR